MNKKVVIFWFIAMCALYHRLTPFILVSTVIFSTMTILIMWLLSKCRKKKQIDEDDDIYSEL